MKDARPFRLDARTGWRGRSPDNTVALGESLLLRTIPDDEQPLVDASGSLGGFAEATAIAVDSEDRVYVLDGEGHRIHRFDPCEQRFEELPCIGGRGAAPRQLSEPSGIDVTPADDLVVADAGNRRLQVFSLHGLTLRHVVESPVGGQWRPTDVASDPRGYVFVADEANDAIQLFDPRYRFVRSLGPFAAPAHVAVDRCGRVYVVEPAASRVSVLTLDDRYRAKSVDQIAAPSDLAGRFEPVAVAVDAAGNVYLTERATGRLYVLGPDADPAAGPRPSRAYEGAGTALGFDAAGNPLVGGARVVQLRAHGAHELRGTFESDALDSTVEGCTWHRVRLRADVPGGGRVVVHTYTSDVELPASVLASPSTAWRRGASLVGEHRGDWDCLILSPPGRYLWLRVELEGDGLTSPAVHLVVVEVPRRTSADHLPAVYRQDAASRDFVERFMALFDEVRGPVARTLDQFPSYLDPDGVPASETPGRTDFLGWLGSWLGLVSEGTWSVTQRRALLREAPALFELRGTPEGLRRHVRLYTGLEPKIVEHFRLRRWSFVGHTRLGDSSELWSDSISGRLQLDAYADIGGFELLDAGDPRLDPLRHHAHRFTIYVPVRRPLSEAQHGTLKRIVELAKPAHTTGEVLVVGPRMRIGSQSRVGVDTVVAEWPEGVTTGENRLGTGSILGPSRDERSSPTLRIGRRARIGSSTLLD